MLHGSSIGGGLLLGLAADHRVATRNATFVLGVAPYGLSPVVMATRVLPMLLGSRFSTRMYIEDVSVDSHCAMGSNIVHHSLNDPRKAREYASFRVVAGCHLGSPLATIERHVRHFIQETLLNIEADETVRDGLLWP